MLCPAVVRTPELIWSFAPWLAFLLAMRVPLFYGAIGAAVVPISRHRLHLPDVTSLGCFAALGAALPGRRDDGWLAGADEDLLPLTRWLSGPAVLAPGRSGEGRRTPFSLPHPGNLHARQICRKPVLDA